MNRSRASFAAVLLATYTFIIVSRIADSVPVLHLGAVGPLVGLSAVMFVPGRSVGVWRARETRLILGLFALALATIPLSVWPGQSFASATEGYSRLVFYYCLIAYGIRSEGDLRVLLAGFLIAIVRLGAWALWSASGPGGRVQVTQTYDTNDLAFIIVCATPLAIVCCLRARGLVRLLAGASFALGSVTVVLTGSRGGFLGLLFVVVLSVVRMRSFIPLRTRVLLVLFVALVLGGSGGDAYWARISTIVSGSTVVEAGPYDASGIWRARWPVWEQGLRLMLSYPLLGVGAGAFEVGEGLSHSGEGKWSTAHNSFLQIGAELGLGGLALFVALLVRTVVSCRTAARAARADSRLARRAWLAPGVEMSVYGYIVAGFSLSQAYSPIVFLLAGMATVLYRLSGGDAVTRAERAVPSVPG